jgi:hypothetical protein
MRVRPCDKFFYLLVIRKVRPDENQTGLTVTMTARTTEVRFVSILFGFTLGGNGYDEHVVLRIPF